MQRSRPCCRPPSTCRTPRSVHIAAAGGSGDMYLPRHLQRSLLMGRRPDDGCSRHLGRPLAGEVRERPRGGGGRRGVLTTRPRRHRIVVGRRGVLTARLLSTGHRCDKNGGGLEHERRHVLEPKLLRIVPCMLL